MRPRKKKARISRIQRFLTLGTISTNPSFSNSLTNGDIELIFLCLATNIVSQWSPTFLAPGTSFLEDWGGEQGTGRAQVSLAPSLGKEVWGRDRRWCSR